MQGIIQSDGKVLGDDSEIYSPDMIHGDTILLASYSWNRVKISNVEGKRVTFVISKSGHAYNFDLIKK